MLVSDAGALPRGGTSEPSGTDHTPAQISVLRSSALFRGCHRGAKAGSYPLLTAQNPPNVNITATLEKNIAF